MGSIDSAFLASLNPSGVEKVTLGVPQIPLGAAQANTDIEARVTRPDGQIEVNGVLMTPQQYRKYAYKAFSNALWMVKSAKGYALYLTPDEQAALQQSYEILRNVTQRNDDLKAVRAGLLVADMQRFEAQTGYQGV